MSTDAPPTLRIAHLSVAIGDASPVRDVSFDIEAGRCLGLVGESGCGKTLTGLAIMGLAPELARLEGQVEVQGTEMLGRDEATLAEWRGRHVAMIFQEPHSALNPVMKVADQIAEMFLIHRALPRRAARQRAIELLDEVRVPDPARRAHAYPHQLSGGMRQRVMIAMAIALGPALLIADEPTTALDVTVQGEILELIAELSAQRRMSVLLISHNLAVVARTADEIAVMYRGRIVERAPTAAMRTAPAHPYSALLLDSVPVIGQRPALQTAPRTTLTPASSRDGCSFAPRCRQASPRCHREVPQPTLQANGSTFACWHPNDANTAEAGPAGP